MTRAMMAFSIGCVAAGFGLSDISAAQGAESVWRVSSSVSNRSLEVGRFAGIECDEFQLGNFIVAGERIVADGVHPVTGAMKITGTLGANGTIHSMGNSRTSVWVTGKFMAESAAGRWGETNFGCAGEWSAERAE